ncbi:unnamed protein product [Prorocentrum cordatum]|uniref:AB hydrolase-1 domain-containing protein n=1 Tax=Prorocentrum cordatum TaxID=2364126 RepID=A0ABN9WLX3_9DINO|nr:unnamed protein product [Polarella glacialis]
MPEDAGPQWFRDNVSAPCESRFVTVEGCRIHYLAWRAARGDEATTTARRAGLVFLHGNAAHAHWWSFLAPFFAQSTTASPSPGRGTGGRAGATGTATTSGRGRHWRAPWNRWPPPPLHRAGPGRVPYEEVAAAAQDAELLGGGRPRPILVAHSMGAVVGAAVARQGGGARWGGCCSWTSFPGRLSRWSGC